MIFGVLTYRAYGGVWQGYVWIPKGERPRCPHRRPFYCYMLHFTVDSKYQEVGPVGQFAVSMK